MAKTDGMWLPSWLPKISVIAAQKERHETEIMLLKAEHQKDKEKLQAENDNLRAEIDRLKQQPKEKPKFTHLDRPDIEARILLFIAKNERGDVGLDANEIAHRVSVAKEAIPFHLRELEAAEFIECVDKLGGIPMWYIAHEGRRYLIERGLIK